MPRAAHKLSASRAAIIALVPGYLLANAEHDGEKYATSLGAASIDELRKLPAAQLLLGSASSITHPVVDSYVMPKTPYEVFAAGQQNDVPLLLGSNAAEARSLVDVSQVKASSFAQDIEHSFGPLPPPLIAAYPHATDVEARQARLDLERDLRFGWDMWSWARLQVTTGHHPVYLYSFMQSPPFPAGSVYEGWGASHYAELWYVFDHLGQTDWQWTSGDRQLADQVSEYWVNFATSGDPNGPGLPRWPTYQGNNNRVQYLRDPISFGPVPNIQALQSFDSVYTSVRGKPFGVPRM